MDSMMKYQITNEHLLDACPLKLSELIKEMLNPNPDERVSIREILQNEWFIEVEKLSFIQMKKMVMDEEIV